MQQTGVDEKIARAFRAPTLPGPVRRVAQAGTSRGVNISPGSDDDGWIVPKPVRLADGTEVQLYKDGEALRAAFEAIRTARHRVCLEVYIFASDQTGQAFADLLCEKARQGVRVHVIYDSFGSSRSDPAMFERMRKAGVMLQEFHPIKPWECHYSWRPINRDHRKILVIDDHLAGLGGLNVGAEYGGSWIIQPQSDDCCEFWRDNAIGVRGPGARDFLRAFAATWNYVARGGRIRKAEYFHNIESGELGLLGSVPTMSSPLARTFHDLVRNARRSIELTMAYFAPPDDMIDALCRAARRGVRVRLMLPAKCDVPLLMIAARSFYEKLLSSGVEVYERQEVVLHAKALCIDEQIAVLGSTNLDYRSIEYNLEISAIIRNETFGKQLHDLFENDVAFAKRIDLKAWRRRPWSDRFVQWAVMRARYLL